ncbi:MAG: metal ABC transporter substrate-binding protein [Methylocystaceae bacterium]
MNRGLIALLLAFALVIAGCTSPANRQLDSSKGSEKIIMTSFYPIYIMTMNVAAGVPGIKVVNLTSPQTGCLHDYQMKPSDIKNLARAKALVINGADMESFLDRVRQQYPDLPVIVASEGADLIKDQKTGVLNPHLWVSISGAIYEVDRIGDGLAKVDPVHANLYHKNAAQYISKLKEQQARMQKELAGAKNRDIVTFHEAFGYFAREFNLNVVSVVEREPGSKPSAAELAATIEQVKKSQVKALFAEPQYPSQTAQLIARETGTKVYMLDPGVTGDDNPDAYLRIMDKNLKVLKEALR